MKQPGEPSLCYWGAHCGHAVLTTKCNVYHCPFGGECFKRLKYDEEGKLIVEKEEKRR